MHNLLQKHSLSVRRIRRRKWARRHRIVPHPIPHAGIYAYKRAYPTLWKDFGGERAPRSLGAGCNLQAQLCTEPKESSRSWQFRRLPKEGGHGPVGPCPPSLSFNRISEYFGISLIGAYISTLIPLSRSPSATSCGKSLSVTIMSIEDREMV